MANGCFDWLSSGQQSVNPRDAISILSRKNKRFTFVHPVGQTDGQNAYNQVSDTFIGYKKKQALSFLALESDDTIIQLSWGIEGRGRQL